MKHLHNDFMHISILDSMTVLVEAREAVEIDYEKAKHANELIEAEMSGDYGMIIDRKSAYSIVPIDVYKILNNLKHLKAIALVVHKRNFLPISTEKKLFKGKLEVFDSIKEAHEWCSLAIQNES